MQQPAGALGIFAVRMVQPAAAHGVKFREMYHGAGLDSTTAMNLVTSLCQLAAGGRAVVTTIHQPSSRLYQQLDKLLLLSEGHCMYYGQSSAGL